MELNNLAEQIVAQLHKIRFDADPGRTYNQLAEALGMKDGWKEISKTLDSLGEKKGTYRKWQLVKYGKENGKGSTVLYRYCAEKWYFQKKNEPQLRQEFGDDLAGGRMKLMCKIIRGILDKSDSELGKRSIRKRVSCYLGGITASFVDDALSFSVETGQFMKSGPGKQGKIVYKATGALDPEKAKDLMQTPKYMNFGSDPRNEIAEPYSA